MNQNIKAKQCKICVKCKKKKVITKFYRDKYNKSGFRSSCNDCICKYSREYHKKHKSLIKIKAHKYYLKNKTHLLAYSKKYKELNKEKVKKRIKKYKKLDPNYYRKINLKKNYKISLQEFNKLSKNQNNKCAICLLHKNKLKRGLFVDHCHKSNKIRGLLCGKCNASIGLMNENIFIFKNAIKYLMQYKKII